MRVHGPTMGVRGEWPQKAVRGADRTAQIFRLSRPQWAVFALFTVLALLVRLIGVGAFHGYAYDEAYYVATAQNLLGLPTLHGSALTGPLTRFTDPNLFSAPPFGKELIAASIWAFGNHPWAWRLPGAVLGGLLPAAGYFLARFLFPRHPALPVVAGFFLALEGLGIGMSRTALLDSTVVPLATWGILLVLVAGFDLVAVPAKGGRVALLFGGGALLGLALATKWTGGQALLTAGGILALGFFQHLRTVGHPRVGPVMRTLFLYVAALVVLPLAIYVATYLWGAGPVGFANGVPAADGFLYGVVYIQHQLLDGMWALRFTHPWLSPAWTWFLLPRPIYLISSYTGRWHSAVYALSNPLWVWMGGAGLLLGGLKIVRPGVLAHLPGDRVGWGALWIWTAAFYGTWFLTPRSKFDYYFYPMTVAVAIAAAALPGLLAHVRIGRRPWALRAYWVLLILTTLYLFPLWVGISLPDRISTDLVWPPMWGPIPSATSSSVPVPSKMVSLKPLHAAPLPTSAPPLPTVIAAQGYGPTHEAWFASSLGPLNLALPAGGPVAGQVAVSAGGLVYAGTTTDEVVALAALSGLRQWSAVVPNQVHGMPLLVPDGRRLLVVVGVGDPSFRGYNRRAGWIRGTGPNGLVALDARTGQQVWMRSTSAEDMATPLYHAGVLYEVTGSGRLVAIAAASGQILWSLPLTGFDSLSALQYVDGHILVATNQYLVSYPARSSTLWSIDIARRRIAWSLALPVKSGLSDCSVAVSGGIAYITGVSRIVNTSPLPTLSETLFAINAATGQTLWSRTLGHGHLSLDQAEVGTPLATPAGVFIANPAAGTIFAFSRTGHRLWKGRMPGGVATGSPVLAGGRLFWGNGSGGIVAINARTGAVVATDPLSTGPLGTSSPVLVGQTLWFGTELGYVDAVGVSP